MQWCKFADMEGSVIGYFDFINTPNYANLKGVTDPKTYLENIKADGYATSLKYVENLMAVIEKYDLTKYDKEVNIMGYTNSPLVAYTKLSPNHSGQSMVSVQTVGSECIVRRKTVLGVLPATQTIRELSPSSVLPILLTHTL